jgi:flagellin
LSVAVGNTQTGAAVKIDLTGSNLRDTEYLTATSSDISVKTSLSAATALQKLQTAITSLASDRAQVGANISRLETERRTISVLRDNLSAAKSRISDVDVAEESANFAKQQILVQSGTAMLAQANILPQYALRLIG